MGAEDVGGGLLKDGEIERVAARPDIGGEHGRADASGIDVVPVAGEDSVLVGFAQGAVAGVEVVWDEFGGEYADGWRERAVEGAEEVGWRDGGVEGKADDLAEGVDAGVGASGALREDGFPGDVADGFGESALDGWERRLDLPAVEGGAVVGEDEFPERHGSISESITADVGLLECPVRVEIDIVEDWAIDRMAGGENSRNRPVLRNVQKITGMSRNEVGAGSNFRVWWSLARV